LGTKTVFSPEHEVWLQSFKNVDRTLFWRCFAEAWSARFGRCWAAEPPEAIGEPQQSSKLHWKPIGAIFPPESRDDKVRGE
jgi:hypothetical protein